MQYAATSAADAGTPRARAAGFLGARSDLYTAASFGNKASGEYLLYDNIASQSSAGGRRHEVYARNCRCRRRVAAKRARPDDGFDALLRDEDETTHVHIHCIHTYIYIRNVKESL